MCGHKMFAGGRLHETQSYFGIACLLNRCSRIVSVVYLEIILALCCLFGAQKLLFLMTIYYNLNQTLSYAVVLIFHNVHYIWNGKSFTIHSLSS
jgi:hypothetical protein